MTKTPTVLIHKRDLGLDADEEERIRESIERRCQELGEEFPEVAQLEITIAPDGVAYAVNGHATGKHTDIATHATATDAGPAADQVLDKIEKQLRRVHDKRIFSQRRDAQRDPPKRRNTT